MASRGRAVLSFTTYAFAVYVPDAADREVPIRAAGGRAGARVVDVGHQGVGRGPDHGLQVDAGVGERRDGQRSLPAQARRQARAGET